VENEVAVPRETLFDEAYFRSNYVEIGRQQLERFSGILRSIEPYVKHRSLLDVGCGTGFLLRSAHELGYLRSVGVDTSSAAIDIARQSLVGTGAVVRMAGDPVSLFQDKFGVVSFIDSLAHIEHFDAVFSSICQNNLSKDGVLLIRTPCYTRYYFRYAEWLGRLLLFSRYRRVVSANVLHMPSRLLLFTKQALVRFVERHGFTVVLIQAKPDYVRTAPVVKGVKDRLAQLLTRRVPQAFNQNTSIVLAARRNV